MDQQNPDTLSRPARKKRQKATRESVLEVTKELVALKGPASTTVRDITDASGANVAAVNYHFQSKDELVDLAFFEILDAVNVERLRKLEEYKQQAADGRVAPRDILDALIGPVLHVSRAKDGGSLYVRSAYQMRTAKYAYLSTTNHRQFGDVAQRFVDEILISIPGVDQDEASWRYEFARGTSLHLLSNLDPIWRRHERLQMKADEDLPETPRFELNQDQIDRIIDTILPGFAAPPV